MDPATADRFHSDLGVAQKTVNAGVSEVEPRAPTPNTPWGEWSDFVHELALNPLLESIDDKISILQVFAQQVRTGELAANKI